MSLIDTRTMVQQARGGRVVRTGFLEGAEFDRRALAAEGIRFAVHGGFPDAVRVIYTLYPEHIPNIDDPTRVLRLETDELDFDIDDLRVVLGLAPELLGDLREDRQGMVFATTQKGAKQLETTKQLVLLGRTREVSFVPATGQALERGVKIRSVVVPSLRLDVVGAKGFGVSRAYFQGGIENKKVRVNGAIATSSTPVKVGDTLSAEGLGRIEFKRIEGETRRGNIKLELELHK